MSTEVVCWGGDPLAGAHSPAPIPVTGTDVVSDETAACLRTAEGPWTCWQQRGEKVRVEAREPRGLAGVTSMALGDTSACALQDTGRISCWGQGRWGELGDRELWVPLEVVAP